KSSLLRRLSAARPKVADYPFTTLEPVLGTVESPDGRQLVVADVPGLIEGAARGAGLGHEFLAHLERARALLHVIDAAAQDPGQRYRTIRHELAEYGAGLEQLPEIVVLNKIDLCPAPPSLVLEGSQVLAVFPVSCLTGEGIEELKRALFGLIPSLPEPSFDRLGMADYLVYRPRPRRVPFRILRTERGFRVVGRPPSSEALEQALKAAGAKAGDKVVVEDEALEYRP
ncbi:MAG: GTPase ObgE, partial [Thermoleophilia bacterium]